MISIVLIAIPAILVVYGLVPASPDDPTSSALVVRYGMQQAITGVTVAAFLFPAILSVIGLITWIWYPLNGKKLAEIRETLAKKYAQQPPPNPKG